MAPMKSMSIERCVLCSEPMGEGAHCPSCGATRPPPPDTSDPFIGTIVADRYEIVGLLSSGGMGRVYRAVQRMLDRVVAIKIIDPRATSPAMTAELRSRFLTEARAVSRLNHPNVVSVFDFGRTSPSEDAPLFLAMKLIAGPSLADVLAQSATRMPLPRVANILTQTLAALGEAHELGITHRDVKPGNIVLRKQRGESEHVSVIDFGVARIRAERGVTLHGQLLGTPHYMAPETITSQAVGPSVDLYAVGVILFEMLTGRVPFDDASPIAVCQMQTGAPRPNPRRWAPGLPEALVDVCFRALSVNETARYPDAQSLAEAIAAACSTPMTRKQVSIFPPRSSHPVSGPMRVAVHSDTLPGFAAPEASSSLRLSATALRSTEDPAVLVGRELSLRWARELVGAPRDVSAIVLWGKTGTGRTRMLHEVASFASGRGAEVIEHRVDWGPQNEVSYTCLRGLVAKLAGLDPTDPRLVAGNATGDRLASTGLQEMFGSPETTLAGDPEAMRAGVVAALAWAAQSAAKRAQRLLVIAVDDVDLIDSISRACLWSFLKREPIPNVLMLLASEERPPSADHGGIRDCELLGVEPLYLEQYRRWRAEHPADRVPTGLREIVEARLQELEPAPRRVLQAVAVAGIVTLKEVAALLERGDAVDETARALEEAGFVTVASDTVSVTHAVYARVALDNVPAGVLQQLHARAAELLATSPAHIERRAYHLLRARPSFAEFMLVERAVRLRMLRGDLEGAISTLTDAYWVARTRASRGDTEADGWHVFGRKLATALHRVGRNDQAKGLLVEVLQTLGPADGARAPVLEELASIAAASGRNAEAERWRREALGVVAAPAGQAPRSGRRAAVRPGDSSGSSRKLGSRR
ncbi:MAG: protein kinase domain-containing protein [Polyangiaceae bacterium]